MREFRVCRCRCRSERMRSFWSHIDDDWYVCSFSFPVSGCKMHICVHDRPVPMISFRCDSSILFLFLLFKQKLSAYLMYRLSARCARLIRIHWRTNRRVRACERLTVRIKAKFEHPFQVFLLLLLLLRHRHQVQFQLISREDNDILRGVESSAFGEGSFFQLRAREVCSCLVQHAPRRFGHNFRIYFAIYFLRIVFQLDRDPIYTTLICM